MNRLRLFFRNVSILNLLLVSIIAMLVHYIFPAIFNVDLHFALPSNKKMQIELTKNALERQAQYPLLSNYLLIAEQNLFHPERRIIIEQVEKKEEPPLPKPEFVLYGTLITDMLSLAYLEDLKAPRNTPGRGKRQLTLKKGDSLSGFTIKDIELDKVHFVRGEEKITVSIYESHKLKKRENISSAPAASTGEKASVKQPQLQPQPRQQTIRPSGLPPKQTSAPGFNVKEKDRKVFDMLNRINP
jgi:hypothetical protein